MHVWRKKRVNFDKFEIAKNCVNQIFNLNAFVFFFLTGAKWYYHTIYLVFTYFESFTDYDNDIFEGIFNLHIQGSKFGGKINKFGGKSFKKLNSTEFIEFVSSRSALWSIFLSFYNLVQGFSNMFVQLLVFFSSSFLYQITKKNFIKFFFWREERMFKWLLSLCIASYEQKNTCFQFYPLLHMLVLLSRWALRV